MQASRAGSIMSAISGLQSRMNSLGSHLGMWSDWEIGLEELEFLKKDDGSDWILGSGAYGRVRVAVLHLAAAGAGHGCPLHANAPRCRCRR